MVMTVVYARGRVRGQRAMNVAHRAFAHAARARSGIPVRAGRDRGSSGAVPRTLDWRGGFQRLFISIAGTPRRRPPLGRQRFFRGRCCRSGKESIGAKDAPFQRAIECRPIPFSLIGFERGADGGHLGIEIVQIMQQQSFAKHRKLGRAEFVFPVVRNRACAAPAFSARAEIPRWHRSSWRPVRIRSGCGREAGLRRCSQGSARS